MTGWQKAHLLFTAFMFGMLLATGEELIDAMVDIRVLEIRVELLEFKFATMEAKK